MLIMSQSSCLLHNAAQLHVRKKSPATLKCLIFNSQCVFLWKMVLALSYLFNCNYFGKIHFKSHLKCRFPPWLAFAVIECGRALLTKVPCPALFLSAGTWCLPEAFQMNALESVKLGAVFLPNVILRHPFTP